MKTLNNEIIVTRNETFTMDKLFQNKDGSPYIISNKIRNLRWVIVISSSQFEQTNIYRAEYTLPLDDYPKFASTVAVPLSILNVDSFDDLFEAIEGKFIAVITVDDKIIKIEPTDYVYYLDINGVRKYKYAKIENGVIKWYDYECRLTVLFTSEDTSKLVSPSYTYSISLVGDNIFKPILLPTKLTVKNKL